MQALVKITYALWLVQALVMWGTSSRESLLWVSRWAGHAKGITSSGVITHSAVPGTTLLPYSNLQPSALPLRLGSAPSRATPPLCPTCSGQLCLCVQQWAGRMWRVMLSHLQNMLVCPPVLLNNEEVWRDIHHIGRCSKCSRVLVRVHIWLAIRGSILERTSGSVMSVVRPSDKPLSQWFIWEPTEGTNPMNVRVWEDLSSLLPSQ